MVADPFTLLQCWPTATAPPPLCWPSNKVAKQFRRDAIEVRASHLTSGRFMTGFRDMTSPEITVRGAKETFEEAGIGRKISTSPKCTTPSRSRNFSITGVRVCPRGQGACDAGFGLLRAWAAGFR